MLLEMQPLMIHNEWCKWVDLALIPPRYKLSTSSAFWPTLKITYNRLYYVWHTNDQTDTNQTKAAIFLYKKTKDMNALFVLINLLCFFSEFGCWERWIRHCSTWLGPTKIRTTSWSCVEKTCELNNHTSL